MKIRQALKIRNQTSPPELHPKCRIWWDRYHRALIYSERLSRRRIRKMKSNGHTFISDEDIDELCNRLLKEEYGDNLH